jgi:hypothetical protein
MIRQHARNEGPRWAPPGRGRRVRMRLPSAAAAGAVALALAGCSGAPADRAGQVIVEPSGSLVDDAAWQSLPSTSATLDIVLCVARVDGLIVRGHVPPGESSVVIDASRADKDRSGVRVGVNDLVDRGVSDAAPGDFLVLVPWADPRSVFAVRTDDQTGEVKVRCPGS